MIFPHPNKNRTKTKAVQKLSPGSLRFRGGMYTPGGFISCQSQPFSLISPQIPCQSFPPTILNLTCPKHVKPCSRVNSRKSKRRKSSSNISLKESTDISLVTMPSIGSFETTCGGYLRENKNVIEDLKQFKTSTVSLLPDLWSLKDPQRLTSAPSVTPNLFVSQGFNPPSFTQLERSANLVDDKRKIHNEEAAEHVELDNKMVSFAQLVCKINTDLESLEKSFFERMEQFREVQFPLNKSSNSFVTDVR